MLYVVIYIYVVVMKFIRILYYYFECYIILLKYIIGFRLFKILCKVISVFYVSFFCK